MANIRVSDLLNKIPAIMIQETQNPPMTYRHADDLPVSGEYD